MDEENKSPHNKTDENDIKDKENNASALSSHNENSHQGAENSRSESIYPEYSDKISDCIKSVDIVDHAAGSKGSF